MSAIVAERGENDELEYRVAWLDGNSWHTQWLPVAEVLHVASLCSIFDSAWCSYLLGRVTPEAAEVLQIDRNAAAKADVVRMALAEGLTLVHAPNPAGFLWVSWRRGAAFCKKPYEVQMWKGDGKRGGRNLSTAGGYFATSWEAGLAVARHLGPERSAQMAASCMLENGRRAPTLNGRSSTCRPSARSVLRSLPPRRPRRQPRRPRRLLSHAASAAACAAS